VVALTTFDADELVRQAINAGAVGYLVKDTPRPTSSTRSGLSLQGRVCCHRR
jgi:DNA-binding NarL/FixJ family response regulator